MSLYTPQIGEVSDERLRPVDRERVVADLLALRLRYPKLALPKGLIEVYANPPDIARRVRLRAHDDDHLGRFDDARSRRASSAARPTAATAAASRRPAWRRSRGISCSALIPVGSIFDGSLKVGQQLQAAAPGRAVRGLML